MLLKRSLLVACCALLLVPAQAWAVEFDVPDMFSTLTGALSLLVAIVLLVIVLQLRKVAEGSAMAENISYVAAATLCFAAAVLLNWLDRFVASWLTLDQVRIGSDVLLACSMSFFAVYFWRLNHAMRKFLNVPDEWKIAAAQLEAASAEGHPEKTDAADIASVITGAGGGIDDAAGDGGARA